MRDLLQRLVRRPSIYQLIYLSFLAMVVPFALALGIALTKVGDLAAISRLDVLDAQQATINAQMLAERLTELERVTLQYRVLRDEESRLVYQAARAAFLQTLRTTNSPLPSLRQEIETLAHDEAGVFALIPGSSTKDQEQTLQLFSQLYRTTQGLLNQSQTLVTQYANQPPAAALDVQRALIKQIALLLPVAVLLAALMLRLITRPIHRVEEAIQQLGRGELATPIHIDGPRDLAELGGRLEWLRQRLRALEAEKMTFLRNISHELKTPLTSIREGSDLLRQDYTGGEPNDQLQIAQILYENSLRLQLLIDNLLHFNTTERAEHGAQRNVASLRLDDVIKRVLDEHRLAIASKGVFAQLQLSEVTMIGNADELHSVVDNLVANALKFSPKQGTLRIQLTSDEAQAMLDVADDGPGIAVQDAPHIFDLFYQGAPPADAVVKGTGLGLAIAKDFVVAHRGHIDVLPAARGAHLRVTLPLNMTPTMITTKRPK